MRTDKEKEKHLVEISNTKLCDNLTFNLNRIKMKNTTFKWFSGDAAHTHTHKQKR